MNQINHLYLLVHPFYKMRDKGSVEKWGSIWVKSINLAAQDPGTVAITYFSGRPHDRDKPDDFVFFLSRPSPLELMIGQFVQDEFGKDRSKIVMFNNLYPFTGWTFDERFARSLSDKATASVRGVYAERCVYDGYLAVMEAYGIPSVRAQIVHEESIFAERNNAMRHRLPDNILP